MKKQFIEPKIRRIELRMTEKIATSEKPVYSLYDNMFLQVLVRVSASGCFDFYKDSDTRVFGHGLSLNDLIDSLQEHNCFVDPGAEARALSMRGRV